MVLVLVAEANVPAPPLQVPARLAVAVMFTAVAPQMLYGPPALAVAAVFTVTVALDPKFVPTQVLASDIAVTA